jgi:hypothetical protein
MKVLFRTLIRCEETEMRDPGRIKKLLTEIEKYWSRHPDLRLCQLIENFLPTDVKCTHCSGNGWIPRDSSKPATIEFVMCLRCQGSGSIWISNYSIEDTVLLEKLEKENEKQERDFETGPVS